MYDIIIIGAGVVGCAIARELARYDLVIGLFEKADDVGTGASKGNSGIVHGGYAEKPGSVKARFSYAGNRCYQQLDNELHFGFQPIGSLVVGFDQQDAQSIATLYEYGQRNGVPNLQIVDGAWVREFEPHLNQEIATALYCPHAGIVSPYEFTIALAENALQNGVRLRLNEEVLAISPHLEGFLVQTNTGLVTTKVVINAAGLYADRIAAMVGAADFTITPRQGQYLLFDKPQGELVKSVIFQVPTAVSKGVLVTKTTHGNLLIGPDATTIVDKEDLATKSANLELIIQAARRSLPNFELSQVITTFAGNRAAAHTNDFIIGPSKVHGFFNVAGIESPGLTAAPAIAAYLTELLAEFGLALKPKPHFNPERPAPKLLTQLSEEAIDALIRQDPSYGRIICRCELVSEGEIRAALRRPIPITSLDAVKRRTRVGMGRCQGGFCTAKVLEIISAELGIPQELITKKGKGSTLLTGKSVSDHERL